MTKFMVLYMANPADFERMMRESTPEQQKQGMDAWRKWMSDNQASLVDGGRAPRQDQAGRRQGGLRHQERNRRLFDRAGGLGRRGGEAVRQKPPPSANDPGRGWRLWRSGRYRECRSGASPSPRVARSGSPRSRRAGPPRPAPTARASAQVPRSGPRRRFPASSSPGSTIGGNRPKLTFIGWNERGPASIELMWPPVMWLRRAPIAVVAGGGSRARPRRSEAASRPAISPTAALST